jgi:hypothetical protein
MGTSLVYTSTALATAGCCNSSISSVCTRSALHVECTFKHVFTEHTMTYKVPLEMTITEFLQYIDHHITNDFNFNEYEIVFTSSTTNTEYAEYADALEPSTITLVTMLRYNEFPDVIGCFYVREKNFITDNATNCPVCLCNFPNNIMNNNNFYNCNHKLCRNCFRSWRTKYEPNQLYADTSNRRKCPLCRTTENRNLPPGWQSHTAIPRLSTIFAPETNNNEAPLPSQSSRPIPSNVTRITQFLSDARQIPNPPLLPPPPPTSISNII